MEAGRTPGRYLPADRGGQKDMRRSRPEPFGPDSGSLYNVVAADRSLLQDCRAESAVRMTRPVMVMMEGRGKNEKGQGSDKEIRGEPVIAFSTGHVATS